MGDIIYCEFNNWSLGKYYPAVEPFLSWLSNDMNIVFNHSQWVKSQKMCVVRHMIDMSTNYCITTTREWVEKNCPELLTKYQEFLRYPDKYGEVYGQFGDEFLSYEESNFGIKDVWDNED